MSSCLKRKFKPGFSLNHRKTKSQGWSMLKTDLEIDSWAFQLSNNQSSVLFVQFTQMGECASLSFMLLGMIPWDTRAARSGGVPCRVWRRSSYQLLACWQVSTAVLSALPEGVFAFCFVHWAKHVESCSAAAALLKALVFIYKFVNQCSEKGWEKCNY